tara:strand:- start:102 stop:689 length:588 start_codon:yes stop_codon:yes gene_type:complete
MLSKMDFQAARYTMNGEVAGQEGNNHPTLSPMGVFDTSDGLVNLAASTNKMFKAFCKIMNAAELEINEDYKNVEGRLKNREKLWQLVNEITKQYSTSEMVEKLNSVGLPCGPINTIDEAFADEQVQFLKLTKQATHTELGDFDLLRSPINLSEFQHSASFDKPGPDLGEHSLEILTELDYSTEQIEQLRKNGAFS